MLLSYFSIIPSVRKPGLCEELFWIVNLHTFPCLVMTHWWLSSSANKIICWVASIFWETSLLSVSETLCLQKGVLEHPFFLALLWFPKSLASQPYPKIGSIFAFSLTSLQDLWCILDIHVSQRRWSQPPSPELLKIDWKSINCINFREETVFSWCEQSASSCVEVDGMERIVSHRQEAILPFGSEADITDLFGDSPCKQQCMVVPWKSWASCIFSRGWARKMVEDLLGRTMCPCRHEARAAPAPWLLSRLTRSVSRVHSWAVMVHM